MAVPLVSALAAIPWSLILKQAPRLLAVADALLTSSKRRSAELTAATDVQGLRLRVVELEKEQEGLAALVKELTELVNAVTLAAQVSAVRARQALVLGAVGVGLGLAAAAMALLR